MDMEIEELGKQAKVLVDQLGSELAGTPKQQTPATEKPPLSSEAGAQAVITELKSVYSFEQITRLWNNQEAEQLHQ